MKRFLATLFLKLAGWKLAANVTDEMKHSVMVAAPHTSNWDFPYALAAFWLMDLDLKYFIKKVYSVGLQGYFFRWTGAVGVDQKAKSNLSEYAIEQLKAKKIVILVPAEGTRKRVEKWRTGFYRIALEAKVPISLGYLDYKKKEAGTLGAFWPSGDFQKDMDYIADQYRDIVPKFPEKYNTKIY
jgi:1-acyl-sn-glycerol-3-phosphate acyltransferase